MNNSIPVFLDVTPFGPYCRDCNTSLRMTGIESHRKKIHPTVAFVNAVTVQAVKSRMNQLRREHAHDLSSFLLMSCNPSDLWFCSWCYVTCGKSSNYQRHVTRLHNETCSINRDAKIPCFPTICGRLGPRSAVATIRQSQQVSTTPSIVGTNTTTKYRNGAASNQGGGMPANIVQDITSHFDAKLDAFGSKLTLQVDQLEKKVDKVHQELYEIVQKQNSSISPIKHSENDEWQDLIRTLQDDQEKFMKRFHQLCSKQEQKVAHLHMEIEQLKQQNEQLRQGALTSDEAREQELQEDRKVKIEPIEEEPPESIS